MDLVTQLQAEINNLGMLFYDSVGTLQGQAPPVSLSGEELQKPVAAAGSAPSSASGDGAPNFNVQDASQSFASRLMEGFRRVEQLAAKLPEVPRGAEGEALQMDRIRALQAQDASLSLELQELMVVSEARLEHVQQMYAVLAHDQLMQRQQ